MTNSDTVHWIILLLEIIIRVAKFTRATFKIVKETIILPI